MTQHDRTQGSAGLKISRALVLFIYGFAIVSTVILAMDFFLELFNANESTPFVEWVDRASARIMQPFRGIFPPVEGESGSVFEPALLFGIFMYWLLAVAMQALVGWIERKIAAQRAEERLGLRNTPTRPAVPSTPTPPASAAQQPPSST